MTFLSRIHHRYQRPIACGLLLLAIASCGNSSPSRSSGGNTPETAAPSDAASTNPGLSPPPLTPPGQVDRTQSTTDSAARSSTNSDAAPIAAAPNSIAPNSANTDNTNTNNANTDNTETKGESLRILSCQTRGGLVNDPNAPLNVRSAPDAGSANVVGSLENGALVSIVGDRGNWWQIDAPAAGWVSKNLIDSTCNEKTARIEFPANTMSVTLSDRFFGTGYHHYELQARAGQKLSLETLDEASPLPFVLTASDQDLTNGIGNTKATRWSGTLPADGNYTIVFDSNFRGYAYNIMLSVE